MTIRYDFPACLFCMGRSSFVETPQGWVGFCTSCSCATEPKVDLVDAIMSWNRRDVYVKDDAGTLLEESSNKRIA